MTNLERAKVEQKKKIDDMDAMKFAREFVGKYGCRDCAFGALEWGKCEYLCERGFCEWLLEEVVDSD